jgi:hypothetical protein
VPGVIEDKKEVAVYRASLQPARLGVLSGPDCNALVGVVRSGLSRDKGQDLVDRTIVGGSKPIRGNHDL